MYATVARPSSATASATSSGGGLVIAVAAAAPAAAAAPPPPGDVREELILFTTRRTEGHARKREARKGAIERGRLDTRTIERSTRNDAMERSTQNNAIERAGWRECRRDSQREREKRRETW